jgi:hypothetical protein
MSCFGKYTEKMNFVFGIGKIITLTLRPELQRTIFPDKKHFFF